MIRIRYSQKPASCVAYFLGDASLTPRERVGVWNGRACGPLGVQAGSPVMAQDLACLLDGYDARGRSFLGRVRSDRRCAYDVVVSASKSVSIAALCDPDGGEVIRDAFAKASHELVMVAERLARRQARAKDRWETGSMAVASFVHDASRYGDPHLHAHLLGMNVTAAKDGALYALNADGVYRNSKVLDGIFQRDLAWRLGREGFKTDLRNGVAVLPVAEALCRRLSKGHAQIEEVVDRLAGRTLMSDSRRKALAQIVNDRIRPRRKKPAPPARFFGFLSTEEMSGMRAAVRGPIGEGAFRWDDDDLRRWMRFQIRTGASADEHRRWELALNAALKEPGRPIDDFLATALDRGLLGGGPRRAGERERLRRVYSVLQQRRGVEVCPGARVMAPVRPVVAGRMHL